MALPSRTKASCFYGLVQEGNDFWNAAFFCGSCAVLRRDALEDVGGFATETVTEDAHTALKMHRRGWDSIYIRLPLAAGLATERLALHIGQRMRWARGMTQIFRLDNPLFGRGLTLAQRLCYSERDAALLLCVAALRVPDSTAGLSAVRAEHHHVQLAADFLVCVPALDPFGANELALAGPAQIYVLG